MEELVVFGVAIDNAPLSLVAPFHQRMIWQRLFHVSQLGFVTEYHLM